MDLTGFHLPFNFHLISTVWEPRSVARLIETYEAALPDGGWPNWVVGNHDRSRVASRIGVAQARVAAMLLLTLRGTPTIYQGEEIGMVDVHIPPSLVQDPFELNVPGFGLGRDPVRTPMPWTSAPQGDFTDGQPWLPLNPDVPDLNVTAQSANAHSLLSLYKALLHLRRENAILTVGSIQLITADDSVLAYLRQVGIERWLIALNMSDQPQALQVKQSAQKKLLSTYLDDINPVQGRVILLRPNEGLILEMLSDNR